MLQIKNITKFIQYRGERALSNFVEAITDGRVDFTVTSNTCENNLRKRLSSMLPPLTKKTATVTFMKSLDILLESRTTNHYQCALLFVNTASYYFYASSTTVSSNLLL